MFNNVNFKEYASKNGEKCEDDDCDYKDFQLDHDSLYHERKKFSDKMSKLYKKYESMKVIVNLQSLSKF